MSFYSHFTKYSIPVLENGVKLPDFKIERKYILKYSLADKPTDYEFLLTLCLCGLKEKIGSNHPKYKEYNKRMQEELQVFKELGFCSYLLITWDIINYCKENDIPTGFGRGSAGNCLVLFLVNVTQIDPIASGDLYFERFLNKTRAKFKEINGVKYYDGSLLMDVDLDISFSHRQLLVEWLNGKYKGRIAKLPTTGTYTTKVLIKELTKAYLEYSEEEAARISEMIPVQYGKPKKIEDAVEENEDFKKWVEENPEVVKIAKRLYELNKYNGVHASAWVITAEDINQTFPLRLTKEGELCSVYTMDDSLNLAIKVDILGLRCATLIDKVCKMVKIDPLKIPFDDEKVYQFLQNIECPKGLFQIEGDTNHRVAKEVKPKKLAHLAAIVAVARPGAIQFVETFAKYVETGEFQSVHPFFDDILKDTAGIPIYQESLLKMANKLGFTLSESETLRRIVGKKKKEEIAEWEEKVKIKVKEQNLDPKVGDVLWRVMDDSANYSFNMGHSFAYGLMSYVTAYLKYYYPTEFFLALLELSKDEQNTTSEIETIQSELPKFGIKLLGPDIVKSDIDFKIEDKNIRFGLGYIKGVAEKSFEKLKDFRQDYPNKFSIFKSAEEAKINISILSALIMSGAMDDYLNESRSKTVLEAQTFRLLTAKEKKLTLQMGEENNYNLFAIIRKLMTTNDEKGKPLMKDTRAITLRTKYQKYKSIYEQNSKNEKLCAYWFETKLLGFSYSHKLFEILKEYYDNIVSIDAAKQELNDTGVTVCGEIKEVKYGISKNKNKYCKVKLADSSGDINCLMFETKTKKGQLMERLKWAEEENNGKFEEGWIVVGTGTKKQDSIFCDKIQRLDAKIYTKLADLPKEEKDEEID